MSKKPIGKNTKPSEAHDRHHAEKRRKRREASHATRRAERRAAGIPEDGDRIYLYGLHTVREALTNPRREKHVLHVTRNAMARLGIETSEFAGLEVVESEPAKLDRLLGEDAVHQGVVLEASPLPALPLSELSKSNLLLVLDQVTDPHNVGAILRSAIAFDAGAVITTARHSPAESGVLAKSASGALDRIDLIQVRNLGEALEQLQALDYTVIGLDSEGPQGLEDTLTGDRIALVLGAEGKGLRQKTRAICDHLARIDMPGAIKSLNVSNAAALSLYIVSRHLSGTKHGA